MDACLKEKGLSVVNCTVKFSISSKNTDYVTGARFRCEAPVLKEPNPIDIQTFGMDLVTQYFSSIEWLS